MNTSLLTTIAVDDAAFVRGMNAASAAGVSAAKAINTAWEPAAAAMAAGAGAGFAASVANKEAAEAAGFAGANVASFTENAKSLARAQEIWSFQVGAGKRALLDLAATIVGPVTRAYSTFREELLRFATDLFQGDGASEMIEDALRAQQQSNLNRQRDAVNRQLNLQLLQAEGSLEAELLRISIDREQALQRINVLQEKMGVNLNRERETVMRTFDIQRERLERSRSEQFGQSLDELMVQIQRESLRPGESDEEVQRLERMVAMNARILQIQNDQNLTLTQQDRLIYELETLEALRAENAARRAREEEERRRFDNDQTLEGIRIDLLRLQGLKREAAERQIALDTERRIREVKNREGLTDTEREEAIRNLREIERLQISQLKDKSETRSLGAGEGGIHSRTARDVLGGIHASAPAQILTLQFDTQKRILVGVNRVATILERIQGRNPALFN